VLRSTKVGLVREEFEVVLRSRVRWFWLRWKSRDRKVLEELRKKENVEEGVAEVVALLMEKVKVVEREKEGEVVMGLLKRRVPEEEVGTVVERVMPTTPWRRKESPRRVMLRRVKEGKEKEKFVLF